MKLVRTKPQEQSRDLFLFFILTFILTLPIWLISVLTKRMIPQSLPVNNIGFIAVTVPILVAITLSYKEGGWENIQTFLRKSIDLRKIYQKVWLGWILSSFMVLNLLIRRVIFTLNGSIKDLTTSLSFIPVFFVLFLLFGFFEEAGWMGYAYGEMESRWSTLNASVILGVICFIWHLPLFILQAPDGGFVWIFLQGINIILTRILTVSIYIKTGKNTLSAVFFHAISNLCTMIFPLSPVISAIVVTLLIFSTRAEIVNKSQRNSLAVPGDFL